MTTLNYLSHKNAPILDFLTIVKETEKAYFVESYDYELCTNKKIGVWIPKSALEFWKEQILTEVREYCTLKKWFRLSLTKNNKKTELKVLGLMAK